MRERMRRGELYLADDPRLQADYQLAQSLLERFNASAAAQPEIRLTLLQQLLGTCGEEVVVRPPLLCDYGQYIHIGEATFINYGAVLLDVQPIRIGVRCQVGPGVQILTATHPVDPHLRSAGWEAGRPVTIGDNVWLGGGVIVCPGVSIGADSVIGAGSVVTRDIPAGVVAVGSPARVVRSVDGTSEHSQAPNT